MNSALCRAAELHNAGILTAISMDGSWEQRNLLFNAGNLRVCGLSPEIAYQLVALNPAKLLGIDSLIGRLASGASASIFLSEGDPTDMKEANLRRAWILGNEITLDNIQLQLYRRYEKKYGVEPR
jgi:imidazolonepropionase-like amidohydrolase